MLKKMSQKSYFWLKFSFWGKLPLRGISPHGGPGAVSLWGKSKGTQGDPYGRGSSGTMDAMGYELYTPNRASSLRLCDWLWFTGKQQYKLKNTSGISEVA